MSADGWKSQRKLGPAGKTEVAWIRTPADGGGAHGQAQAYQRGPQANGSGKL